MLHGSTDHQIVNIIQHVTRDMEIWVVPYYFRSILGSKTNKNVGFLILVEKPRILSYLSKGKICDFTRNHPQAPRVHLSP